jgi:hypothetical protein
VTHPGLAVVIASVLVQRPERVLATNEKRIHNQTPTCLAQSIHARSDRDIHQFGILASQHMMICQTDRLRPAKTLISLRFHISAGCPFEKISLRLEPSDHNCSDSESKSGSLEWLEWPDLNIVVTIPGI